MNMNPKAKKDRKTILVVEDEQSLLGAIKTKLLKNDFEVVCCGDVESGLKFVADMPEIDFIWLDHYLCGGETGMDFMMKIKQNFPRKKIPVIVVSVSIDERKYDRYMDMGAEKFYVKSDYGLQEIIDEIKLYFKNKKL